MILEWLMSAIREVWLLALHLSGNSGFPRPLTNAEEADAIRRLTRGDKAAKEELIVHNLRLAAHIAKKYASSGVDADDLVSIGSIGLIKAVNTFRPEAGRLTSYASRCIENEILMYLRAGKKNRGVVSLNDPVGSDGDGNEVRLLDLIGTDADTVPEEAENAIEIGRAVKLVNQSLDEREKEVIVMRYGLFSSPPKAQHEVAKRLGISRSYVSRIEKRALEKLRAGLNGFPPQEG